MLEDLEKGDVAETIRIFFEKSINVDVKPASKSTLTLRYVDGFIMTPTEANTIVNNLTNARYKLQSTGERGAFDHQLPTQTVQGEHKVLALIMMIRYRITVRPVPSVVDFFPVTRKSERLVWPRTHNRVFGLFFFTEKTIDTSNLDVLQLSIAPAQ